MARVYDSEKLVLPEPQTPQVNPEIELKKEEIKVKSDKNIIDNKKADNEASRVKVAQGEGMIKAMTVDNQINKMKSEVAEIDSKTILNTAKAESEEAGIQLDIYTAKKESLKQETGIK